MPTFVATGEGHAVTAPAGSIVSFEVAGASQVVDLNLFNSERTTERFGSSVSRPVFGSHLSVGDQLLSNPPYERPLAEVVLDEIVPREPEAGEETAPEGVTLRNHDLLYGRCSRGFRERFYGFPSDGCQELIANAIAPFDLTEFDVHDPYNIFMTTGMDDEGNLHFVGSQCGQGSRIELKLLVDCIVAFSCCPGRSSGPNPGGVNFQVT